MIWTTLLLWFRQQGLHLSKKPRRGVQVIGSAERIQSALRLLASQGGNPYRQPLRPEERVRFILSHLLKHPDKTRIQDLADRLGVCPRNAALRFEGRRRKAGSISDPPAAHSRPRPQAGRR